MKKPLPELRDPALRPFPLTSIRPDGWLRRQLRIQADGLCGHLDEFWPDVRDSGWFGGSAEAWERGPYWLDGALPLAYLIDDPVLKSKVTRYIDYIITHQEDDGWLGKAPENRADVDLWCFFLVGKVLCQYADITGDERVGAVLEKMLKMLDRHIVLVRPLANWSDSRWFECLITIQWLYERKPEQWLWDLAAKLRAQGFGWAEFFEFWPLTGPTQKKTWDQMSHVVNNALAVKAHGLWWRHTGREWDRLAVYDMINKLDRHHGMVTGMFTGDECLSGLDPVQGTELCAVVDYMYSLEILTGVFGDPAFGDRLELLAFNSLPAAFLPDMWAHQYDQQVNQVEASIKPRPWSNNNAEANIFGLEPHYGCCTANFGQGWPKFAASLWMAGLDGGIYATAYAPSVLFAKVGDATVQITLDTQYPFRDRLKFTVVTDMPVVFPLMLRIPSWAEHAVVEVEGHKARPASGRYHAVKREWSGTVELTLTLPTRPKLMRRPNKFLAIRRGPLVYSLPIGETRKRVNEKLPHREPPHCDWELYPATPWNYGLDIRDKDVGDAVCEEHPVGNCPFSPEGAPVSMKIKARRIPGWITDKVGNTGPVPEKGIRNPGAREELRLIPYGCTNLRLTEFPTL